MLAINFMESSQGPAGPIQLSTFPLDSISVLDAVTFTIMLNKLPIRTKLRLKNPKVSQLATILLPCKRISHQDFTSQATNTSPTVSYSRESSNQVPRSLCCLKAVVHFCYFFASVGMNYIVSRHGVRCKLFNHCESLLVFWLQLFSRKSKICTVVMENMYPV